MIPEKKLSNIFEAAAGKDRKKKSEESQIAMPAPSLEELRSQDDLEAQYARCKQYSEEIKKKINKAYEEVKISPRDIKKYLETPQNFSDSQWKAITKTKNELDSKLAALVKKQEPPESPPELPPDGAPADVTPKSPKPKRGFTTKKTWIPVR